MKQHKWAKEIHAWADGAEIEYKKPQDTEWMSAGIFPAWSYDQFEYRIKPQPKEPQYLYVYEDIGGINITSDKNYATKDMEYIGKIKLEQDE